MIEPFFFGPRKAFACYQPANDLSSTELVVICPPLFDEYRRCYRAIADLANACAAKGKHVIRFDYSGTGESQGVAAEFTVRDWLDDIDAVVEEGIALTGVQTVVLVGVRFGATLATQCKHSAVSRFVLWDPVTSGQDYLLWLSRVDKALEQRHRWLAKQINRQLDTNSFENFELGKPLAQGIAALTFNADVDNGDRIYVVSTDKTAVAKSGFKHCEFTGFEYGWPEFHEGNFHPKPVLERIAQMVIQK